MFKCYPPILWTLGNIVTHLPIWKLMCLQRRPVRIFSCIGLVSILFFVLLKFVFSFTRWKGKKVSEIKKNIVISTIFSWGIKRRYPLFIILPTHWEFANGIIQIIHRYNEIEFEITDIKSVMFFFAYVFTKTR